MMPDAEARCARCATMLYKHVGHWWGRLPGSGTQITMFCPDGRFHDVVPLRKETR